MPTPERTPTSTCIEQLALLRALVAFLGEKEQCDWWDCSFLGATGRKFLAITYPRSFMTAGMLAAIGAARRSHDARIGKGRVFHLFRLPHATEQRLHRSVLTVKNAALLKKMESKEMALDELESLAKQPESPPDGPLSLGRLKNIASPSVVSKLAGIYLGAFKSSKQTMPYFTATE